MHNLFHNLQTTPEQEQFDSLLAGKGPFRLERIVSRGHCSPPGYWYDQEEAEWVSLLSGAARLAFDDGSEQLLQPGDHLLIPAHRRHRVAWTAEDCDTVWLVLFFSEPVHDLTA